MDSKLLYAVFLSIVFSVAPTFATFLLLMLGNQLLFDFFPDPAFQAEQIEEFMSVARPIGYASLVIVLGLTVLGFVSDRRNLSRLGSL